MTVQTQDLDKVQIKATPPDSDALVGVEPSTGEGWQIVLSKFYQLLASKLSNVFAGLDGTGKLKDTQIPDFTPVNAEFFSGLTVDGKISYAAAIDELVRRVGVGDPVETELIALAITHSNVSTNGGSDGSITATGSGGSKSYQYSFDGAGWGAATSGPVTFSNLAAGTYTVDVRDANQTDQMAMKSVTITEPAPTTGEPTGAQDATMDDNYNTMTFPIS